MSKIRTAMNRFRELRKSEEGSIDTALTIGVFTLPLVLIGSITYFSFEPYTADLPAQEIGTHLEAWTVTEPAAEIPVVDRYISYTLMPGLENFPKEVARDLPEVQSLKIVWSKILPQEKSSEFVICMYRGDAPVPDRDDEIFSYDSVTGQEVNNESEICL